MKMRSCMKGHVNLIESTTIAIDTCIVNIIYGSHYNYIHVKTT